MFKTHKESDLSLTNLAAAGGSLKLAQQLAIVFTTFSVCRLRGRIKRAGLNWANRILIQWI